MSATHKAIYESSLPRWLKDIAAAFACFEDYEQHTLYPSVERVAWMLNLDPRQVKRGTAELRDRGVLQVVRPHAPGRTTLYRLELSALPYREPFVPKKNRQKGRPTGDMGVTCFGPDETAEQVTLATAQVSPMTPDLPERTPRKIKITGAARRRSLDPVENVASRGHYVKIAVEAVGISLTQYRTCRYGNVVSCFKDLCGERRLGYDDPMLPERALNAAVGNPRTRTAIIRKAADVYVARYPGMSRRDVEHELLSDLNVLFSEKRLTPQEERQARCAIDDAWTALGEFRTVAAGVA